MREIELRVIDGAGGAGARLQAEMRAQCIAESGRCCGETDQARLRWRTASNRQTAVAAETLRHSTVPAMGMRTS